MIIDNQMVFDLNVALTTTRVSTNVIDLQSPSIISGQGTTSNQGRDLNSGDGIQVPKLYVECLTTFTSGTSMNVQFQGAPDNGSGSPGSYSTFAETGVIPVANLFAGARIAEWDLPGAPTNYPIARFIQLNYVIVGTMATANIYAAIVLSRDEAPQGAGLYFSGYKPGFVVAN